MDIGFEKCAMIMMKKMKNINNWRNILLSQENYKYLVILEAKTIKQVETKEKVRKEDFKIIKKPISKPDTKAKISSKE